MTQNPNTTLPREAKVKQYIALITQLGLADPTEEILLNTLGEIVWTRDDTGLYIATLTNELPQDKTIFQITSAYDSIMRIFVNTPGDSLGITTANMSNALTDSLLQQTPITIQVFTI